MKSVITNMNVYVNKLRCDFALRKERRKYLETFSTDYNHMKMKENFDIVLDNIEELKEALGLKQVPAIVILIAYMIHNGYLSENGNYEYKKQNDIREFKVDDKLSYALKIFSGFGCCRHTACFGKMCLDRFGIYNETISTFINKKDYNLNQIEILLNNYHKKPIAPSHLINYIKDEEKEWLIDLTGEYCGLYYVKKHFYYPFFKDPDKVDYPRPIYNYSIWKSSKHDYQNAKSLPLEEQEKIAFSINETLNLFQNNDSLFKEFYIQNLSYYKEINYAYQEIYEKEKRLGLIRE